MPTPQDRSTVRLHGLSVAYLDLPGPGIPLFLLHGVASSIDFHIMSLQLKTGQTAVHTIGESNLRINFLFFAVFFGGLSPYWLGPRRRHQRRI